MNNSSMKFPGAALRGAAAMVVLALSASGLVMAQGTPGSGPGHQAGGPPMMAGMPGGFGHHGGAGLGMSDQLLDTVGATADQKTRIHEIMAAARSDLLAQHTAGRALRSQMIKLMAAPQIDGAAIEALRQQQLVQHDAASRRMTQAMIDAGSQLSAPQRQQLGDRIIKLQDMGERHRMERRAMTVPRG